MRSQVMQLAHALRKTGLSFGQAITRAWKVIRLKLRMLTESVTFAYIKENGETRQAIGYYGAAPKTEAGTSEKPGSMLAIRYFDTEVAGWRSFRADRLVLA